MPRTPASARVLAERLRRAGLYERLAWYRRLPIRRQQVLYESFSGNGMLCNPEAVFRALLADPRFGSLRHVWVLSDFEHYAATIAEFAGHPRVRFVRLNSDAYYVALATSGYLVNNSTFPPMFAKRAGQVYLNTWHGTPLKAMGYEIRDGALATRNIVRNFLNADYLLAPNEATERMYLSSYRMTNVFPGALLHTGTPRVDRQFVDESAARATRARLRAAGIDVSDDQRVILYAPTWRGDFYAPDNDTAKLRRWIEQLRRELGGDGYCPLLKVHQHVYRLAAGDPQLRAVLVPNELATNEILATTDVLVTDYSSIFVDFLATGRPVLFFVPDLDSYAVSRGLNMSPEQWPGPVCRKLDELVGRVRELGDRRAPAAEFADRYEAARQRFCPREDGRAAERLVDVVFGGRADSPDVRRGFSDGRKTILIYLGGMRGNGITTSAMSLLDNIDHSRYDVSVFYLHATDARRTELVESIHPAVRHLPRLGGMIAHKLQVRAIVGGSSPGRRRHSSDVARYRGVLRDEWVRCFGTARFDHIIDFSGYAPLWTKVLLQGERDSFSIWQHNDLAADAAQTDKGKVHNGNLQGIFSLYQFADHIVSVSPSLAQVNREKLGRYAAAEKFTYAWNTINHARIRKLAYGAGLLPAVAEAGDPVALDPADLVGTVARLMGRYSPETVADEVERQLTLHQVAPPRPGVRTFVTVGRLSPEKNHQRLIRAFAKVHRADPQTRLVIIGSGVLRQQLEDLIVSLGLSGAVRLAGFLPNPYAVMSTADCFVMSSDYEGQPIVLLEALVLGLPVVTTAFGSVRSALPEGHGTLVDCTVDALADGMLTFLGGDPTPRPFDPDAYNREAMRQFYVAVGAEPESADAPVPGPGLPAAPHALPAADALPAAPAGDVSLPAD